MNSVLYNSGLFTKRLVDLNCELDDLYSKCIPNTEGMNEEEIITEINNIENNKEIILSGKEGKS